MFGTKEGRSDSKKTFTFKHIVCYANLKTYIKELSFSNQQCKILLVQKCSRDTGDVENSYGTREFIIKYLMDQVQKEFPHQRIEIPKVF